MFAEGAIQAWAAGPFLSRLPDSEPCTQGEDKNSVLKRARKIAEVIPIR